LADDRPLVALTMGDVTGIGPEVIARAWTDSPLLSIARPVVIGHPAILVRAIDLVGSRASVEVVQSPEEARPADDRVPCLSPSLVDAGQLPPGRVDPRAGRAAHDYLIAATDLALAGRIDALVTLPINKEAFHAAGIPSPGHTEVLAERCGVADYSMMLYLGPPAASGPAGLGVVHATLHVPLREVFDLLTSELVERTILLADRAFRLLTGNQAPRIAVAGLNPHAGENGLFGAEERTIIAPAVERGRRDGVDVTGPSAADTLFARALAGEFDAVVAMYHDQGHVALKTVGFDRAVNVTLGLPIVRTSVAHGTAFDIAWKGRAETTSLVEAVRVAARLAQASTNRPRPRP
jgi:4-hydroxythreonine-4-phosphate dehydrogenase